MTRHARPPGVGAAGRTASRRRLRPILVLQTLILLPHALHAAAIPWETLHNELREEQLRHRVPVLTLVIMDSGEPALVRATGLPGAAPVDAGTPFRWGSISKTVTALVTLEAARRQALPLHTPVRDVLDTTPFRNPWRLTHPLRVAHLLELATGLPDLSGQEFSDNIPHPLDQALATHADERVMRWPPGLQHSYSNVPPGIAAAVVEQLTGQSFDSAARRLVLEPLGMTGASYQPVPGLPGGFRADGTTPIPYWHMTFPAFGALNASPRAMAALLQALLNGGRVAGRQAVASESVARMYRADATAGAAAGLEISYGAGLYGWVNDGYLWHGHGGDADGYRARLGLLRGAGRGYLVGINVDDPQLLRRLQQKIERALTADLTAPRPPAAVVPDARELERFTGRYYPASARFGITRWQAGEAAGARVELDPEGLVFRSGDIARKLIPLGGTRFRRQGDPAASVVFVEWQGSLFLQGELGNFARVSVAPCADFVPVCQAHRGWPTERRFGMVVSARRPVAAIQE